jgi:hypothetical protein
VNGLRSRGAAAHGNFCRAGLRVWQVVVARLLRYLFVRCSVCARSDAWLR